MSKMSNPTQYFSTLNKPCKLLILAFETGVTGGSISLFDGEKELDAWVGEGKVSRSEDVLEEMNRILTRNGVDKAAVNIVVTSLGPGSFTGLRIGVAIAKGFCKSVNSRHISMPLLETILPKEFKGGDSFAAVVPFAGNRFGWQIFREFTGSQPMPVRVGNEYEFNESLRNLNVKNVFCHHSSFEILQNHIADATLTSEENAANLNIVDVGKNMAVCLARSICRVSFETDFSAVSPIDLIYPVA